MIAPGATIGLLGGGQLGRMMAIAAARLGYRVHVFDPGEDPPAGHVSAAFTCAGFDDLTALERFAASVAVVTLEWENIPVATLAHLQTLGAAVHPGPAVLQVSQSRAAEKQAANDLGLATAPWRPVATAAEVAPALAAVGGQGILKTDRLGYDGRGQVRLGPGDDPAAAFAALGSVPCILEGLVNFQAELSVVLARTAKGAVSAYPPGRNQHEHGILRRTVVPAGLAQEIEADAQAAAGQLAEALGMVGTMAVEFFLTGEGRLLVNEIAPRPHNSGHWTIDACACCQFEQQVRAICGLPLGPTAPHSGAEMINLLGDDAEGWPALLADPGAILHLYGKGESRPGRKMGHVTRLLPLG